MEKVVLELFPFYSFVAQGISENDTLSGFVRKSMNFVVFVVHFFHSIHYSRPASGRMEKIPHSNLFHSILGSVTLNKGDTRCELQNTSPPRIQGGFERNRVGRLETVVMWPPPHGRSPLPYVGNPKGERSIELLALGHPLKTERAPRLALQLCQHGLRDVCGRQSRNRRGGASECRPLAPD